MKWHLPLIIALILGCKEEAIIVPVDTDICKPELKDCDYTPGPIFLSGEMIYGKVTGLKNCIPFEASIEAYIHKDFDLIGLVINTYEQLSLIADKEYISIVAQTQGGLIGKWPMIIDTIPNIAYQLYYIMEDYDQVEEAYDIDNGYEFNYIEYCKIDSINKTIYGNFEARFITLGISSQGNHPDTVLFSNCVFEAWHPE